MLGELFLCTVGEDEGDSFIAIAENLDSTEIKMRSITDEHVVIWNLGDYSDDLFVVQRIVNGIFVDMATGKRVIIDSDPDFDSEDLMIAYFESGSRVRKYIRYSDFIIRYKRVYTFKFIIDDYANTADVYMYPDRMVTRGMNFEMSREKLKVPYDTEVIYVMGFWVASGVLGMLCRVTDGFLDW